MEFGTINLSRNARLYKVKKKLIQKKHKDRLLKLGNDVDLKNVRISYNNYVSSGTRLRNVDLGIFSYVSMNSQILNARIGKFCSIGDNVKIGLGFHPTDYVSTHPSFYSADKPFKCFGDSNSFVEYKETIVENDVWIGANVMIFGGVTIGNGAILAGGAIITKDVEPYSIVGGNPAKIIRYRFSEDVIRQLLQGNWWEKDLNWITENYRLFNNTELFLNNKF